MTDDRRNRAQSEAARAHQVCVQLSNELSAAGLDKVTVLAHHGFGTLSATADELEYLARIIRSGRQRYKDPATRPAAARPNQQVGVKPSELEQ